MSEDDLTEFYRIEIAYEQSVLAVERRARRAAKRVGFAARKSRRYLGTTCNQGGFALISLKNPSFCKAGHRYDLSADQVIEACNWIEQVHATNASCDAEHGHRMDRE